MKGYIVTTEWIDAVTMTPHGYPFFEKYFRSLDEAKKCFYAECDRVPYEYRTEYNTSPLKNRVQDEMLVVSLDEAEWISEEDFEDEDYPLDCFNLYAYEYGYGDFDSER